MRGEAGHALVHGCARGCPTVSRAGRSPPRRSMSSLSGLRLAAMISSISFRERAPRPSSPACGSRLSTASLSSASGWRHLARSSVPSRRRRPRAARRARRSVGEQRACPSSSGPRERTRRAPGGTAVTRSRTCVLDDLGVLVRESSFRPSRGSSNIAGLVVPTPNACWRPQVGRPRRRCVGGGPPALLRYLSPIGGESVRASGDLPMIWAAAGITRGDDESLHASGRLKRFLR